MLAWVSTEAAGDVTDYLCLLSTSMLPRLLLRFVFPMAFPNVVSPLDTVDTCLAVLSFL